MDLKQYEDWKFAFAEIIRSARAIDATDKAVQSECVSLLARLAEDKFNLLVVGRFSRGKSSLMNAILGGDLLPTGIVPLTSVITTVRYGTRKQVVLNFSDNGLRQEIPLSQLGDYVTQRSNPGNTKNVSYAEIELPVEILRRGFFFVDTPGLGSPIVENTLTTERFLPEADAFILVTSFESPVTEDEDRILRRICNTKKKTFLVVNKQDMADKDDRAEVLQFVQERLKTYGFQQPPLIFSISARQALAAKLSGQHDLLRESGLPILEEELRRFLVEERAQAFLSNMYERTLELLFRRTTAGSGSNDPDAFKALMKRLRQLKESIFGSNSEKIDPSAALDDNGTKDLPMLHMDRASVCVACGKVLKATFDFLSKYQYQLSVDPDIQHQLAERRGFCPLHTWQYQGIASPFGISAAYPALTHRIARDLQDLTREGYGTAELHSQIAALLPTRLTCRVCEELTIAEAHAVAEFANSIRQWDPAKNERVPVSCLRHLALIVESLGDSELARQFIRAHAQLLERTAEDLQRYAIKFEGLRRFLASAEERQAGKMAMVLLAGHRNVAIPWVAESVI